MSKTHLLIISIIVLVALNFVALGTLFIHNRPGPPPPRRQGQGPRHLIIERLNLDRAQVEAYEKLIAAHQKQTGEKEQQIRKAKNALYQLLQQEDHTERESLIQNIGMLQMEIEEIHFDHFADLKALCSPEQLEAFQRLTNELARLFGLPPNAQK